MRESREFEAIMIVGAMNGGARQLALWKLLDRCCHGGRLNLPQFPLLPRNARGNS